MRVSGQDWLVANTNVSGYFRVNYDLDNWNRLLSLLNTNHQVSHTHAHSPFQWLWYHAVTDSFVFYAHLY